MQVADRFAENAASSLAAWLSPELGMAYFDERDHQARECRRVRRLGRLGDRETLGPMAGASRQVSAGPRRATKNAR
jgi:hypothetical protein